MKMNIFMPGKAPIILGFMGIKVVQNDLDFFAGMRNQPFVHKGQKLPGSSRREMVGLDHPRSDLQGSKKSARSMAFRFTVVSCQRLPIRKAKLPSKNFERRFQCLQAL